MIEPSSSLFYEIAREAFGQNANFATKCVRTVNVVPEDHPQCKTLCIGRDGIIFVNEDFWQKHVETKTDAKILLLHETMHAMLHDTTKESRGDKDSHTLKNLAMDIRINAIVWALVDRPDNSILTRLYKNKELEGLLRPQSKYSSTSKYKRMYDSLYQVVTRTIYGTPPQEYDHFKSEESFRAAIKYLINDIPAARKILLIGSHGTEEQNDADGQAAHDMGYDEIIPVSSSELEEIKSTLKDQLKDYADKGLEGGLGSTLFQQMIKVISSSMSLNVRTLANFSCAAKLNQIRSMIPVQKKITSVIPINPCARDMTMLASGYVPSLWKNKVERNKTETINLAIYLDVSGSVGKYLPKLLGIISSIHTGIKKVFCFSTVVDPHSIAELKTGVLRTTGGTCFNCIIDHAVENNIDKFVIFTDGHANVSPQHKAKAERKIKDVAIVYFGSHHTRDNFWDQNYSKIYKLEELINH